ncbi:MAG: ATP-binding protein [Myxococcota bacterium]
MSTQLQAGVPLADGSPARKLLEELAHTYSMILVADARGRVSWMSDGWIEACGLRPDFGCRDLREGIATTRHPAQAFAILERMRDQGYVVRARVERSHDNPRSTPLDLSIFPLRCSTGGAVQVILAREEPMTGSHPEAALLDALPDAVLACDGDGFVSYANPATERVLGLAPGEVRGCALAVLPADGHGLSRLLRALETTEPVDFEIDLRTARPEPRSVAVSLAPRPGGDGCVLTLRTAAEQSAELVRRNDELEHCINTLAHDLRSPLVALLGFSRLLRQDYGERFDDTGAHFLDRIEQAGRTMEALIHDLLELSRIGQPGEHPAMVDPRAVLLQLAAELKPRLDSLDIDLVFPKDPPLVYCDHTRLYQVFSNLIGNAVEHMGDGGERTISVSIAEDHGFHRITVRDRGRGIAPEHHERIFEAFQSLGSRQGRRGRSGMGLAIVRKIADTRGGRAWVESSPGTGAAFHFTLPTH